MYCVINIESHIALLIRNPTIFMFVYIIDICDVYTAGARGTIYWFYYIMAYSTNFLGSSEVRGQSWFVNLYHMISLYKLTIQVFARALSMMASSNGKKIRITGRLWGDPPVTDGFPSQRPATRSFDAFFDLRLKKNSWTYNRDSGDLRRHCAHYDVTVMRVVLRW